MGKKRKANKKLIAFLDGVRDTSKWVDYDDVNDLIEDLIDVFHDPQNAPGGKVCDWCLLDAMAVTSSPKAIDFFYDLALNKTYCSYPSQVAIYWLSGYAPESKKKSLLMALEHDLYNKNICISRIAALAYKYLGDNTHTGILWQVKDTFSFDEYEQTQAWHQMILKVLTEKATMTEHIAFHPIPGTI